jgi:hypothetical protein
MEDTKASSSGEGAAKQQGTSEAAEFIASTSFTGSRDGYVFTTGAVNPSEAENVAQLSPSYSRTASALLLAYAVRLLGAQWHHPFASSSSLHMRL